MSADETEDWLRLRASFKASANLLGLTLKHSLHSKHKSLYEILDDSIKERIEARYAARKAKDWALADKIRKDLLRQGIVLEDGPAGTTWRRV
jgi:cysteinyl-tRNA synthetase